MNRFYLLLVLASVSAACLIVFPRDPIPVEQAVLGHEAPVSCVSFRRDGSMLASGSWDGSVILWDAVSHEPLGEPLVAGSDVFTVAFSPDGRLLAAEVKDGRVLVWDVATRRNVGPSIRTHEKGVSRVAFRPDGGVLASGSLDHTVILWSTATWQPLDSFPLRHPREVRSVAFSPRGERLASATDREVFIWNLATRATMGVPLTLSRVAPLGDRPRFVDVAFSPGGGMLATAGDFGNARQDDVELGGGMLLWDLETRRVIGTGLGFGEAVSFSPDGKTLALASGSEVLLWDVSARKVAAALEGYTFVNIAASVQAIAFSPDGKILAAGGGAIGRGSIIFWDVETRLPIGNDQLRR